MLKKTASLKRRIVQKLKKKVIFFWIPAILGFFLPKINQNFTLIILQLCVVSFILKRWNCLV